MSSVDVYQFIPSGHEAREPIRSYSQPDRRIKMAYDKWLKMTADDKDFRFGDHNFLKAVNLVKDMRISYHDAHALLITYWDDNAVRDPTLSLFVSALYHVSEENDIVFDLNLENAESIDSLAYRLPGSKRFINLAKLGQDTGQESEGALVNYGTGGNGFGYNSSGPVINFGNTYLQFGICAKGPVINLDDTSYEMGRASNSIAINFGYSRGMTKGYGNVMVNAGICGVIENKGIIVAVNPPNKYGYLGETKAVLRSKKLGTMPELLEYVSNLRDKLGACGSDYRKVLQFLDGLGEAKKIENDVRGMLRRHGYDVRRHDYDV